MPLLALMYVMAWSALWSAQRATAFYWMLMWTVYAVAFGVAWRWPGLVRRALPLAGYVIFAVTLAENVATGARPGMIYNPNAVGSWIILLLPWSSGVLWWFLGLAALLVTLSRGALLGWVVALVTLIWRPRWYLVVALVVVLAAGLAVMRPNTVVKRWHTWNDALTLFLQRPVFGWGPGSYYDISPEGNKNHADSLIMTVAAELGVLGLMAWGVLIFAVSKVILGPQGSPARLALAAWGIHQLVDYTLWFPAVAITVAACLALLARHAQANAEPVTLRIRRAYGSEEFPAFNETG
jgi:hypothetical protein